MGQLGLNEAGGKDDDDFVAYGQKTKPFERVLENWLSGKNWLRNLGTWASDSRQELIRLTGFSVSFRAWRTGTVSFGQQRMNSILR
jgi:hypothetical protein